MEQMKEKKSSVRDEFAEKFISILESGKPLSWTKGWVTSNIGSPCNGYSGRKYNGINKMILMMASMENNWNDNRFYTFKQVAEMEDCKVKAGSKAIRVEYWMAYDLKEKKSLHLSEYAKILREDETRNADEFKIFAKTACVFNAKQIDGIKPLPEKARQGVEPNQLAEEVIKTLSENMGVNLIYGGDSAFYSLSTDSIFLPDRENFVSEAELYGTTLHEFSHASGAETRLNRDLKSFTEDSDSYAIEELRAEIASTFLTSEIGIEMSQSVVENHLAYVQSWLSQIKENHGVLFSAIRDAEKISDYILEIGRVDILREKLEIINEMPRNLENVTYEIWQLKDIPENEMLHFTCFEYASKFRLTESRYEKIYEATATKNEDSLDKLYYKFNVEKPNDYKGHSMSVSDIVVLHMDGRRKAWFCDDVGFKEVPEFCMVTERTKKEKHR